MPSDRPKRMGESVAAGRGAPVSGPAKAPPEDEAGLMARVLAREEMAYAVLLRRYSPRLMAMARRMLGNDGLAEDVTQETLVRLWTHTNVYDPARGSLAAWLYRIAANLAIDRMRRNDRLVAESAEWDRGQGAIQERHMQEQDLARRVDRSLQALPERQRLALVLCHYEELSMKEAASIMDISDEAVSSLLGRARRTLRQTLQAEWRALLPEERED